MWFLQENGSKTIFFDICKKKQRMKKIKNIISLSFLIVLFITWRITTFWMPVELPAFKKFVEMRKSVMFAMLTLPLFIFVAAWYLFNFWWAWLFTAVYSSTIYIWAHYAAKRHYGRN